MFHGSVAKLWHHAAEKHTGELIVVNSERRPGDCQHPISDRFGKRSKNLWLRCPACSGFQMVASMEPHVLDRARSFWKTKWWRGDSSAAAKARREYTTLMRQHASRVWHPTPVGEGEHQNRSEQI